MVTGASRGIGREIALGYARAGGGSCSIKSLDVTDRQAVQELVSNLFAEFGRIDVLCNNAGVNSAHGPVADIAPDRFAAVHAVNLIGLYACLHAVTPHMIERRYGRIVNVSSGSAIMCAAEASAYASSKAAVNALTIAHSKEVHAHNILVNAMSPGSVKTDMNPTSKVPAAEAVPTAVWLASLPDDGPSGRFFRFMQEYPMLPEVDLDWSAR